MSLLSKGSSTEVKRYLFGLFEDCKVQPDALSTDQTMEELWRVSLWSLLAAFEGFVPERDAWRNEWPLDSLEDQAKGQELAGGFSSCCGA